MTPKRQTGIRLDEAQLAEAERMAAEEKRTTAAMIRILLDEAIEARRRTKR